MRSKQRKYRTFNEPGHAHELTFSCFHKYKFLSAERTCRWLADAIETARVKLDFALWAYVFMPDHVHLIVCPRQPDYDMSDILQAIKEPVGRRGTSYLKRHAPSWIPRITQYRGGRPERHFWQPGRGFDRNVIEPKTLLGMIDYIHLNPVRRGLVDRTRDWRWSSAAWYDDRAGSELVPDPIPPEWAQC